MLKLLKFESTYYRTYINLYLVVYFNNAQFIFVTFAIFITWRTHIETTKIVQQRGKQRRVGGKAEKLFSWRQNL